MKHTFNIYKNSIRLIVSHNGKKYKKYTGLTIDPRLWKSEAKSLDKKCQDRRVWNVLGKMNARLVEKELTAGSEADVLAAMDYALTGHDKPAVPERPTFWEYFKLWAERDMPSRRFRQLAFNRVSALMGTAEDWEDINGDWYFRLVQKLNDEEYSHNYKSTLIGKVRSVLIEGKSRGYHSSEAYKCFKTSFVPADTIALTQEEVESLWNADLYGKEADARDAFIVGVYTAARFQNYSQLSLDNIQDGKMLIQFKQKKTQGEVLIPASPRVLAVLQRNGGRVPRITMQEVGRHIKNVCKAIGGSFNDIQEVSVSKGNRYIIEKKHRWELVSSHTARRTGATLLYKSGLPIRICRFLTGHQTDSQFLQYIKIQKEEAAEILAKSEFFK